MKNTPPSSPLQATAPPPEDEADPSLYFSIAISVVPQSALATLLIDVQFEDAKNTERAALRKEFLVAVNRHIDKLKLDSVPKEVRPHVNGTDANSLLITQLFQVLTMRHCSDCRQLFVNQPDDKVKVSEMQDVDYSLFCGGQDHFGPWRVSPLGLFVKEAVFAKAASRGAVCIVTEDKTTRITADDAQRYRDSRVTELHAFNCFVSYYKKQRYPCIPRPCIVDALAAASRDMNIPELIGKIFPTMMMLGSELIDPPAGLMLWGPPGTGKTSIACRLIRDLGFAQVNPSGEAIAPGETKGGLEGLSEAKMKCLLRRPLACPWRHFGLVIDEIESLVRNRFQKDAPQSGADAGSLGIILSWFGGARIPNLFLFCATNLRKQIDLAFLRRISSKVFVGLPSAQVRSQWVPLLKPLPQETRKDPDFSTIIPESTRSLMTKLTLNFSAANMVDVMLALQQKCAVLPDDRPRIVTDHMMREACSSVAEKERVFIGATTASSLFDQVSRTGNKQMDDLYQRFEADFGMVADVILRHSRDNALKGRMMIDLSALISQDPLVGGVKDSTVDDAWSVKSPHVDVELLGGCVHVLRPQVACQGIANIYKVTSNHFLALLLEAASRLDMSAVRVVDNAFFSEQGCDNEQSCVQCLREEATQFVEYKRSMLVMDLDSVFIDINRDSDNVIHENVQRKELLGEILHTFRNHCTASTAGKLNLMVLITTKPELASRATHDLAWPMNPLRQLAARDKKFDETPQKCTECGVLFKPSNSENECKPHMSRYLVSTREGDKLQPSEMGLKTLSEVNGLAPSARPSFVWSCCNTPLSTAVCGRPEAARPHTLSIDPPSLQIAIQDNSRHGCVDISRDLTQQLYRDRFNAVWCSFCSKSVAEPASGSSARVADECKVCGCGAPLFEVRFSAAMPKATSCFACMRHEEVTKFASKVKQQGQQAARCLWFTRIRDRFALLSRAQRAAMEWATTNEYEMKPTGEISGGRCRLPVGPLYPHQLFLHPKPIDGTPFLAQDGVAPADVSVYVACAHDKKCDCTPNTAAVWLFLRVKKAVFGGATCPGGSTCPRADLKHFCDVDHGSLAL
jgi:hypothetical protein